METLVSVILCKDIGDLSMVFPPDEIDMFNFALVDLRKPFDGWVDENSPFKDPIPLGTRWIYSVHMVEETGHPECPLKAGKMVSGPFIDLKQAETVSDWLHNNGCFGCIYAALVVADRNKMH